MDQSTKFEKGSTKHQRGSAESEKASRPNSLHDRRRSPNAALSHERSEGGKAAFTLAETPGSLPPGSIVGSPMETPQNLRAEAPQGSRGATPQNMRGEALQGAPSETHQNLRAEVSQGSPTETHQNLRAKALRGLSPQGSPAEIHKTLPNESLVSPPAGSRQILSGQSAGTSSVSAPGNSSKNNTRWTANKKSEIVLRILRGEPMEEISREIKVPVHKLAGWRDSFIEHGRCGLKSRKTNPAEEKLRKANAKIGELTMLLELHEKKDQLRAHQGRSKS